MKQKFHDVIIHLINVKVDSPVTVDHVNVNEI